MAYNELERKLMIGLLKKNAPSVYATCIVPKQLRLTEKLHSLREQYKKTTNMTIKDEITHEGAYIKKELEIYSSVLEKS